MQRILAILICLGAVPGVQAGSSAAYLPGLTELPVAGDTAERLLAGHVWYPTLAAGEAMRFGENAVFAGVLAHPQAPTAPGRFPLVVLSHGLDGNSLNQGWLAKALAEVGFIVAAPNHPGTTTWDRDPERRAMLWERPRDLRRTISMVLNHPIVGAAVDPNRVGVIGHSLGGFTVLTLAGAQFDIARHRRYCLSHPARPDCVFAGEAGVHDAQDERAPALDQSGDLRIGAIVTLDLALTQALDPASLSTLDVPVLVLGAAAGGVLDLDAESRALVAMLPAPSVRYVELADAGHYDFVGTCKAGAQAVLVEEDPDFVGVCADGGAARELRHAMIASRIKAFLFEALR